MYVTGPSVQLQPCEGKQGAKLKADIGAPAHLEGKVYYKISVTSICNTCHRANILDFLTPIKKHTCCKYLILDLYSINILALISCFLYQCLILCICLHGSRDLSNRHN